MLVGCGGGSTPSSATPAAPSDTIGGFSGAGAPFDSGTVKVIDARGRIIAENITINADGSYITPVFRASDYTAPFVIVAEGQIFDAVDSYVAIVTSAGQANVTPLSSGLAASIAGPSVLKLSDPSAVSSLTGLTTAAVSASLEGVRAMIAPMYAAFGGDATANPLTSRFNDAFDKLLDNLKIDVKPSGQMSIIAAESQIGDDDSSTNASRPAAVTSWGAAPMAAPAASRKTFSVRDATMVALVNKLNACLAKAPNSTSGRGTSAGFALDCQNIVLNAGDNTADAAETYINNGKPALEDLQSVINGGPGWELGVKVGTPQIIRQIDDTRLEVLFPIVGTTESGGQRNALTTTIKLFSTLNGVSGSGFRLIGNQRKFNVSLTTSALKVTRTSASGSPVVTFEPSLNFSVGYGSSIDTSTKLGAARICGPGLPGYVSDANPCGTKGGVWMVDAGLQIYGNSSNPSYQSSNRCSSGLTVVPFRVFSPVRNDAANTMFSPSSGSETFSTGYAVTNGLTCINNFRLAQVDAAGAAVANTNRGQTGAAAIANYSGTPLAIGSIQAGDAYRVYLYGSNVTSGVNAARQETPISTPNGQGYYVVRLRSRPLSIAEITSAPFAVFDPALVAGYQSFKTAGPILDANNSLPLTWTYETGAVKINKVNLQYNGGGDQCSTRFSPLAPPSAYPTAYANCSKFASTSPNAGKYTFTGFEPWVSGTSNISLNGQDRFGTLFITRLQ